MPSKLSSWASLPNLLLFDYFRPTDKLVLLTKLWYFHAFSCLNKVIISATIKVTNYLFHFSYTCMYL